MSILRDAMQAIALAELSSKRLQRSPMWRSAKARLLKSAALLETEWQDGDTVGAREEPLGESECQDPGLGASTNDLKDMLTRLLGRPPLGISPSSTAKTNVVSLPPSNRRSRT